MSQDDIQKIKNRLGIEEVIGSYIKLEKSGNNLKARCPFHNEKTPSFYVSTERNSYYCFGCGAKGDIFNFVQAFEGLDFMGSLKMLALRAGVELSNNTDFKEDKTKILYEIMKDATEFFQKNLEKNKEALEYLKSRGLKEETIFKWKIGFAKNEWKDLFEHLKNNKYLSSDIEKAGLIKKGERGDYYDRFRSRIIFPISDSSGRVIAFTGRIFGDDKKDIAKYLNSPETVLFDKSKVLFGFDFAKNTIRKLDFSILVEGQMDTIMAHQIGYTNTIASSGTALTQFQLQTLNRFSEKLVIAYDADKAGLNASKKAWQIALSLGMDVKIANLKEGDPAEIIKEDKEKWRNAVKDSKHIIEFLTIQVIEKESDQRKQKKIISKEIIPYLSAVKSSIEKSHFVDYLSEKFNIESPAIWSEISSYDSQANEKDNSVEKVFSEKETKDNFDSLEKRLFGIYFLFESKKDYSEHLTGLESKMISILGDSEFEKNKNLFKKDLNELIFQTESLYKDEKYLKKDIKELLENLNLKILIQNRIRLKKDLIDAEKDDPEKADTIWQEINNLSKKINELGKDV